MKKLLLIFVLIALGLEFYAQGNNCNQATAFCDAPGGAGVTFPNNTNTTAPSGPNYGCLFTQPNPAFFFIKTSAAGTMDFTISQVRNNGTPIDVDFIAWGPFTNYATMCNSLTAANIEDCSYSLSATENMTLVSPGPGNYFVIMITNYSGLSGNITFSQTGGPASDCSITCPSVLGGDGIVLASGAQIPSSISCGAAPFDIRASTNVAFGDPVTPGVMVSFQNNGNTNNSVTWYENGTSVGCFGPAPCLPLTTNTNYDLQFSFMSPSAVNTFSLCETNTTQPNMTYTVTNLANNAIITTGTWTDDGACQTIAIPAGAVTGTSTFTASCGACVTSTDYGYATFNPATAGPGTHTVTYTFNPGNGCAPYTFSKTITISTPSFSVAATPTAVCSGSTTTLTATSAQTTLTFSNTTDFNIPDANATGITSNINVSGLTGTVGTQLVNVTLNINHPYDGDLDISLRCPNGTVIVLSTDNGGAGDNYVNTIFSPTATTNVTAGVAPFTGTFLPEQLFSNLSGCTMNGTWSLLVADDGNGDVGTLLDWSITFNNPLTYTWAPATQTAGLTATTGSVVTANPTATTTYTVTGTDGSGCSATRTITVNVLPSPTMTSANAITICSGDAVGLPLTSDMTSTYSWVATDNPTITGESTTAQTGATINNTLTLTGTTQTTVIYTVTPTATSNSCPGQPQTVTVTVNPRPVITAMNNINTACINTAVTVPNFTVTPAGSTVNWTNNNVAIGGLGAAGTGNIGTFTPTTPGVATISASAAVGTCTITPVTFSITVNALPNVTSTSTTVCSGLSASITASGADTYSWNTSATGATLTINPATTTTTYTVTGTNTVTTCTNTATGSITITPGPVMTSPNTGVTCSGATLNFPLTATIVGTTFSWVAGSNANVTGESTTAQSGATITDLLTNTSATSEVVVYTVTPTSGSCLGTPQTITVTISTNPAITGTPSACLNATSQLTGFGTPAPTNPWVSSNTAVATVSSTGLVTGVSVGSATITYTDNTGCFQTVTFVVFPSPTITGTLSACVGATSQLTGSGTAATTNAWTSSSTGVATISANGVVTGVSAGTSTITYTNNNGCPVTATFTVNAIPTISGTLTACVGVTSALNGTGTPATTNPWVSASTGTVTITSTGLVTAVAAGTSTITYTDINGCNTTATFTVNPTPQVTNSIVTTTGCGTATANLTPTSSVAGTTFNWTASGSGGTLSGFSSTGTGNINETISNSGTTTGTVTYVITPIANGCSGTPVNYSVVVNPGPTVTNVITTTTGCGTVTASLTPTSNIAGATFAWTSTSTGGTLTGNSANGNGNINESITNSGTTVGTVVYSIVPTANGCNGPAVNYTVVINPIPQVTNVIATTTGCQTANASLTPTSNVAGATFSWTATNTAGSVTGFTANGTGSINETLTNTGTVTGTVVYVITPTANGCSGTPVSYSVVVNPGPTVTNVITTTTGCGIATASLSPTSNVAGATFTWTSTSTGGTLTGNSANGNGNINESITNSGTTAGTVVYSIVPTANGCNGPAVNYTVVINPIPQITNVITTTTGCQTANASLTPTSNVAGVTFTWSATNTAGSVTGFTANGTGSINETLTNTGTVTGTVVYVITPTANGCSGTPVNYTVTIYKNPIINITGTSSYCSGSSSVLTATGANTYTWTPSSTLNSPNGNSVTASPTLTTIYTATGTDGNNCVGSSTFTLTVNPNPTAINFSVTTSACNAPTGSVTINGTVGGTATYQYNFNNLGLSATTNYTGLAAGSYPLTVSDLNGCTFSTFANIVTATGPTAVTTTLTKDSCGRNTGIIQINAVTGGTAGYQFSVDGSATSSTSIYPNLSAGPHSIVVTDNAGCNYATTVTIQALVGPTGFSTQVTNETCTNSNGVINVNNIIGGTAAYTYSSNGTNFSGTSSFTNLPAGTYTITVKDANTCVITNTVQVINNPSPTAVASTVQNSVCNQSNGSITLGAVTGGSPSYTFNINNGVYSSNNVFQNLAANTYTISVKDANNCIYTTQLVVGNTNLTVQLTNVITTTTGCQNAVASLVPTANQPNATFAWTVTNTGGTITGFTTPGTGNINQALTNNSNSQGTVVYVITPSASGCTGTPSSYSVVINPIPSVTNVINTTTGCGTVNANLTPTSSVAGSTFSWTAQNSGGSLTGYSANGTGSINENVTNNGSTLGSIIYSITPSFNNCTGTAVNYTVNVNPIPSITNPPSPTTSCGSVNASYIPTSNVTGSTFSWTVVNSGGTITGFTTPGTGNINQALTNNSNSQGTVVYAVTPSASGCTGTSISYSVVINPIPSVTNVINTTTGCGTVNANLTPTSSVAGSTFSWTAQNSGASLTGFSANGTGSINENVTNNGNTLGTIIYSITPSFNNCAGTAVNYTVNVNPIPVITNTPSPTVGCGTVNANYSPISNVTGSTFGWTVVNTGGTLNGFTTPGAGNINQNITNNGNAAGTLIYSVIPTANTCQGAPISYSVTVNPIPSIVNSIDTTRGCGTVNALLNPIANVNGATFNWTATNFGSLVTGYTAVGAGTINENLTNTGSTNGIVVYTIVPSVGTCVGNGVNYPVLIRPVPSVTNIINTTNGCGTANAFLNLTSNVIGTTYSWTAVNTGAGLTGFTSPGTGNINQTIVNNGNSSGTVIYSITPSAANCPGQVVTYSVVVNPIPTISGTPSVCTGSTTSTLTGSGTAANFNPWISSNTSVATISSGVVTPVSSGTTTIIYTDNNTCFTTATFTVVATPTVTVPSSFTLCEGSNQPAINLISNPPGATIQWTNDNPGTGVAPGGSIGVINGFTATNNNSANIVSLISVTASSNVCVSQSATFNITVVPTPTVTVSSNSPVCVNGIVSLNSSGGSIYSWLGPNNFLSSNQNPTINAVTQAMAGTYSVSVGVSGGGNLVCQNTSTLSVVVNPLPVVSISNNSPICENQTIQLFADAVGGVNYSWLGPAPNNFASSNQNPQITTAALNMSGNYTVTVTNSNNCTNANVTNVIINPIPPLPLVTNEIYCEDEIPLPLTAVPNFGGTLNWYGTNLVGGTPTLNSPTPPTSIIGSYTYYVSQSVLGCESPRAPLNVTINPAPTGIVSFIEPQCAPLCTDISLVSSSTLTDVQWNLGDGTLTNVNDTINHCYDLPGAYSITVRVTDINGCFNNLIFPNWINVYENPTAMFDYQPTNITLLNPTVTFINQSLGDSIITYSWSFGDQQSTGLQGQTVENTYESAGLFEVQLAVQTVYGCVDTVRKIIEVFEDFNVYIPNSFSPNGDGVNEEFYPQGTGISDKKYEFIIYDRWGELIFSTNDLTKHWSGVKDGGSDIAQQDIYIYKVSCQSTKGDKFTKTGHVTLIR